MLSLYSAFLFSVTLITIWLYIYILLFNYHTHIHTHTHKEEWELNEDKEFILTTIFSATSIVLRIGRCSLSISCKKNKKKRLWDVLPFSEIVYIFWDPFIMPKWKNGLDVHGIYDEDVLSFLYPDSYGT